MTRFTVQNVKLSLIGFAGVMLFWPALLSPCVVSSNSSKQAQIGALLNEKLILFKRGALDTETRVAAMDARSRRAFRAYWAAVGPFSSLIRRRWLVAAERALR